LKIRMKARANCKNGKKIRKKLPRAAKRVKRSLLMTLSIFADNRQIMLRVSTLRQAQDKFESRMENGEISLRFNLPIFSKSCQCH
jgi:hypothetical protein